MVVGHLQLNSDRPMGILIIEFQGISIAISYHAALIEFVFLHFHNVETFVKTLFSIHKIVFKRVIPRLLLWWTFLDLFLKLLIAERYFREILS